MNLNINETKEHALSRKVTIVYIVVRL